MFLVVAAEEAGIGKVVFPCYLLYALRRALQLRLYLQYDVLVYYRLGRVVGHLAHDVGEILRRDVHLRGVVVDVARQFVVAFHESHEEIEQFAHAVRLHLVGAVVGVALHIFVEADEERLELAVHELGEAGAVGLVEINFQQGEHAVDDMRHHGRVLSASVFAQGRIHGVLQLQACLAQERRAVSEHLHLEK